jgi:hypothetical protein
VPRKQHQQQVVLDLVVTQRVTLLIDRRHQGADHTLHLLARRATCACRVDGGLELSQQLLACFDRPGDE